MSIPEELKATPNWCLWRMEMRDGKPTKVPYQPNGKRADPSDPSTWCSYDEVSACVSNFDGRGFVFSERDNFAGIDLDDPYKKKPDGTPVHDNPQEVIERYNKILAVFDSYSEISPSGTGVHTIVKGSVPKGRRRAGIEVYSQDRFFTMTGNVYLDKPIRNGPATQALLTQLWAEMAPIERPVVSHHDGQSAEPCDDDEVCRRAYAATNGEKFLDLWQGNWQGHYASQSEADFAFIDIIAFYTQNADQIRRIFLASALGQRAKAKRVAYVSGMIQRSFDRMLPLVDFEALRLNKEEGNVAPALPPAPEAGVEGFPPISPPPASLIPTKANPASIFPPGLVGEIARFIYAASPRPVKEIALAGAIGLMAGICGRSYNVSNTGLNQYILLVARTGIGKESMASGISRLMSACIEQVPGMSDFVGPEYLASGQGLRKFMARSTTKCFVSIVGEVGYTLQNISAANANGASVALKQALLGLYNKSGRTDVLRGDAYSSKDNESESIASPSLSIIGEGTPETIFNVMRESDIASGLIPRFMMIHSEADREYWNEGAAKVKLPTELVRRLTDLGDSALRLGATGKAIDVQATDEAKAWLRRLDQSTTDQINAHKGDSTRELFNRVHLKTMKLAALVSVGIEPLQPVITVQALEWAYAIIGHDVDIMLKKFEMGDIIEEINDSEQLKQLRRVLRDYLNHCPQGMDAMHGDDVITHAHLMPRVSNLKAFKSDRAGAIAAIKRAVASLIDQGELVEMPMRAISERYGKGGKGYLITMK